MSEPDLKGLKELAETTRFEEVRELCYGLIEKFEELKDDNQGYWDLSIFKQKIRRIKYYVFKHILNGI